MDGIAYAPSHNWLLRTEPHLWLCGRSGVFIYLSFFYFVCICEGTIVGSLWIETVKVQQSKCNCEVEPGNTWDRIFSLSNRLCHWLKTIIFLIPFSFCVVFFKRIFSTLAHSCLRRNIRRAHEVNNTNFGRFPWPEVAWTWLTITWPILLTQNTLASWKSSFRNVFPRWRYSSPVLGL